MNDKQGELFLLDQIPMRERSFIPSTIRDAHAAVALFMQNEPALGVQSALDNRGRFISYALDKGFERLIESGQWPFDKRWVPFAKPTGHYLEIRTSHAVVTISQVEDPTAQPRDVKFRANLRYSQQIPLPLSEFTDDLRVIGVPHVVLVHGHQQPRFAHLALPNERHDLGWIYRTPNLMSMPHAVPVAVPPVEQTDIEAVVTLKEEIDKWRRDHGG